MFFLVFNCFFVELSWGGGGDYPSLTEVKEHTNSIICLA